MCPTGRITAKDKRKIETVKERLEVYKKRLEYVNALTDDYSPEFIEAQTAELNELKSEVMSLIALLDYNKRRLVIERRFVLVCSWRIICRDLLISDTFARQLYREGMIELYNKMKAGGLL